MEMMDGGSLGNYIKTRKKKEEYFEEWEVREIMLSILQGIDYMHNEHNCWHRD
jgi:serine/threonine protein kinase